MLQIIQLAQIPGPLFIKTKKCYYSYYCSSITYNALSELTKEFRRKTCITK